MKVIKITTLWDHNYYFQIPQELLAKYKFEINNSCDRADYWFIWGGLRKREKVYVDPKNVFFIIEEAFEERQYKESFLNQFDTVITCREDIRHRNVFQYHDLGIWYFNKSYDYLRKLEANGKKKKLSVVSSDLTWLPGHKKRYAFVNKLIGHFKDKIDVYGKGFNFIEDKFDALYPYEYSIAIENNSLKNYFTEKIFECYLTYTVPVYYGCKNIEDYFSGNSLVHIDIDNYKQSFSKIEELIDSDSKYKDYLPYLTSEREKVLNTFHFFPAIDKIINSQSADIKKSKWISINMEFGDSYLSSLKSVVKKILK